jgi:polyhydroxybutyrate depolymerase
MAVTIGGLTRSYRLFVPAVLPPGPRPLVIALHWLDGDAARFEAGTGLDVGAAAVGALVAYPDGVARSWNAGTCCGPARDGQVDDVAFIDAIIAQASTRFAIDPARVAVGGLSNGGMMAYRYACERPSARLTLFVGSGVPVAGACSYPRPLSVLHMHGLLDSTVPWAGTRSSVLPLGGTFPSVPSSLSGLARGQGCTGWAQTALSALVRRYIATGCPAGVALVTLSSGSLGHRWATGDLEYHLYGLNETALTWTFLLSRWRAA